MTFESDITGVIYYRGDILVLLKNTVSTPSFKNYLSQLPFPML